MASPQERVPRRCLIRAYRRTAGMWRTRPANILMLVDIAPQWPSDGRHDDATDDDCDGQPAPHAHGHRCGDEESGAPYDPSADKLSTLWSVYPDDDADENTWKIGLGRIRRRRGDQPLRRLLVGAGLPSHHLRDVQRGTRADVVHQRPGEPADAGLRPSIRACAHQQRRCAPDAGGARVRRARRVCGTGHPADLLEPQGL